MQNLKILISPFIENLKNDFRNIKPDIYVFMLMALFTLCFLYPVFIMNDVNMSLLGTIKVDHASMLESMDKILRFRTLYNQLAGYHSSFYGWTYFFISFWLLLPVKIISWIFRIDSYLTVFIGLKILHFIYGLMASLSFYYLARKFFDDFLSFILALIFVFASPLTVYNYSFHPEGIGILFLNLACLYLVNFARNSSDQNRSYLSYWTISFFLILSTLAKPTFLLVTLPVYLCLLVTYIRKKEDKTFSFIRKPEGKKLLLHTFVFSVGTFFIINPFFFIRFSKSIEKQLLNIATMNKSPLAFKTFSETFLAWNEVLLNFPILSAGFIATVAAIIYLCAKNKMKLPQSAYLFIAVCTAFNFLFTINSFRLFLSVTYFIPILSFLLIISMMVIQSLAGTVFNRPFLKSGVIVLFLTVISIPALKTNYADLSQFFHYRQLESYKVYDYIRQNIPDGSAILHDHLVGIPDGKEFKDYHYWRNDDETLKNVKADYIIFNPELKINGSYQDKTIILKNRIKDGAYKEINEIGEIEFWQRS